MSEKEDREILQEARERFHRVKEFESNARKLWLEDYKFANADADNRWQWPDPIRQGRELADAPVLTINKTRQHNLQIINDAKQNKPGITVRATGNGATYDSAQAFSGVIRHIEYQSNAPTAYDVATTFQVEAGLGYLRLTTDYADDTTFDQEIFISAIADPLGVYTDPDAKEPDKSDMKWAFIFEDLPRKEFEYQYPEYNQKDLVTGQSALGEDEREWYSTEMVRRCEYYRVVFEKDELIAYKNAESGAMDILPLSMIPKQVRAEVLAAPDTKRRPITRKKIEWLYIIGQKIVDRKDWPGSYVPIVPVIGEEVVIEGKLDRKGHTRALKDPQRMYNYWSSTAVEYGALQTKTPWIASAQAIEGYETYWNTANRINYSVLPYNGLDDAGNPIDRPQRTEPPVAAPVALQGMQTAGMEMMLVSGQYEAGMGAQGNERSAKAIDKRQRQGENATYHFIDNLAISIRSIGKQVLELIPIVYDTPRIIMIQAENGDSLEVQIDPYAKQAFQLNAAENAQTAQRILNPLVGKYEVQVDVGPSFSTKREEAFNAFSLILTQAPDLVRLIGDILFKAGDFPGANEAAERLRRMVPAQALGLGPSEQEQAMQQQLQQYQQLLGTLMDEIGKMSIQLKDKGEEIEIKDYDSHTRRMDVVNKAILGGLSVRDAAQQLAIEMKEEAEEEAAAKKQNKLLGPRTLQ